MILDEDNSTDEYTFTKPSCGTGVRM